MDRLPFDVLAQIAILAGSDGGHAGCTLAAVSRGHRDAFAPWRYHSVDLRGPRQIRAFLALVEQSDQPPVESRHRRSAVLVRPTVHVRHLFLSDCRVTIDAGGGGSPDFASFHWADWDSSGAGVWGTLASAYSRLRPAASFEDALRQCSGTIQDTVQRLLARLAARLTHLHLVLWTPCTWALVPDLVFPALLELTCAYQGPSLATAYLPRMAVPARGHAHALPRLRRMHLVLAAPTAEIRHRLRTLAPLAPALTHFRVSADAPPNLLANALRPLAAHAPAGLARILTTSFRTPLLMKPPHGSRQHPYYLWFMRPVEGLWRDEEPAGAAGVGVPVLATREDPELAGWKEDRLCAEWLDRMHGGEGGWDTYASGA
jgi:hypothetical protein